MLLFLERTEGLEEAEMLQLEVLLYLLIYLLELTGLQEALVDLQVVKVGAEEVEVVLMQLVEMQLLL